MTWLPWRLRAQVSELNDALDGALVSRDEARAAASEMLDGVDLGMVRMDITRTMGALPHITIHYGDFKVLDGDVWNPIEARL